MPSELELEFANLWVELFPSIDLHTNYRYIPGRKFELDFAQLETRVGIEIQGATWTTGGHSTGKGIQRDCEKIYLGLLHGWLIFPLTAQMIDGRHLQGIAAVIRQRLINRRVTTNENNVHRSQV